MTLEDFANARKLVRCQVCVLFERRPDLKREADAGRAKPRPISNDVIAGYLTAKAGDGDPRPKDSAVRKHYLNGHMREEAK